MFISKELSEEEREKLKEERKRKRQEFWRNLGYTLENLLGELIISAREILYPREVKITDKLTIPLQREKVAIFWDYENFALPKSKIADDLFFKMIYPSKRKYEVVSKRVFSKMQNINKHLPDLLEEGFEFLETTSEEKNATDQRLIDNCFEFCSFSKDKIVIILITGDRGYIKLIKDLVMQGHEVRLIHSSKEAVSKEMERLVPIVLDINILFDKRKSKLEKKMLKEEDSEKWENLWKEFTLLEEDAIKQEESLNIIARNANTTTIRSQAQKQLIELVEEMKKQTQEEF